MHRQAVLVLGVMLVLLSSALGQRLNCRYYEKHALDGKYYCSPYVNQGGLPSPIIPQAPPFYPPGHPLFLGQTGDPLINPAINSVFIDNPVPPGAVYPGFL